MTNLTITTTASYVVNGTTLYEGTWTGTVPAQSGIPAAAYAPNPQVGYAFSASARNGAGSRVATSVALGVSA